MSNFLKIDEVRINIDEISSFSFDERSFNLYLKGDDGPWEFSDAEEVFPALVRFFSNKALLKKFGIIVSDIEDIENTTPQPPGGKTYKLLDFGEKK